MTRGIYLVANLKSQDFCQNLIYSIRESGCNLPIRLIHFGGKEIECNYILKEVQLLRIENFSDEAQHFIQNLRTVLTDCPLGFLYRFLGWFSDWDEFIYSDNDIVALCNWDVLFEHLAGNDLVHADEEYTTNGIYNYDKPESITSLFGPDSLNTAFTAGHIVVKKSTKMVDDINKAVQWFKQYPEIPKKHDQSLLHVAAMIGNWNLLNLCKVNSWLSSWAGDYRNSLHLIQKIQQGGSKISHIHYSGGTPHGDDAIHDLLFSMDNDLARLKKLHLVSWKRFSGYHRFKQNYLKLKRLYNRKFSS